MRWLHSMRCRLGLHTWETLQGDNWGAYHRCRHCDKSKRVGSSGHQADAHERMDP